MSTYFNKTVMVILLCLIFIGQSMASSTMFYKMASMSSMENMSHASNMKPNMHANMSAMAHNMTNMSDDINTKTGSNEDSFANCCQQECKCFASGCSAPATFSQTFIADVLITLSPKIYSHHSMLPEQTLTSPFKPPILS